MVPMRRHPIALITLFALCLGLGSGSPLVGADAPEWSEIRAAFDGGETWATLTLLRRREASHPDEVGVHQSLALVLETLGAYEGALHHTERWRALAPEQADQTYAVRGRIKDSARDGVRVAQALGRQLEEAAETVAGDPRGALDLLRQVSQRQGWLGPEEQARLISLLGLSGFLEEALEASRRWVAISAPGPAMDAAQAALTQARLRSERRAALGARVTFPAQSLRLGTSKREWRRAGARALEEDERPLHRVSLSPYALGRFEVSVAAYRRCQALGSCPPPTVAVELTHPLQAMAGVSWEGARVFCLSLGGRLPTEAEWEAAARGEDRRSYPWGGEAPTCARAHFEGCVQATASGTFAEAPVPVDALPEGGTPEGILNLAGNVSEWVQDTYKKEGYEDLSRRDPVHSGRGDVHVSRGGAFDRLPTELRAARREGRRGGEGGREVGVRCAWDVEGE